MTLGQATTVRSGRRPALPVAGAVVPWAAAAFTVGPLLLVAAFHAAAAGWPRATAHGLFWAGMLPAFLATAVTVGRRGTRPVQMVATLAALGAFGVLPKLLRTPTGPLYFDELAHWRQADELAATGVVGAPNAMLKALAGFPGLHALTASLQQLSGLSTWTVAAGVVVVAHSLATVGVYALVRAVLLDQPAVEGCSPARVAGVAGVVYATNPAWMFFDTQFAYETVALPLTLWTLTLVVVADHLSGRSRVAVLAAVVALAFTVATMHHASALVLALTLMLAVVLTAVRRRSRDAAVTVATAGCMVAISAWMLPSYELLLRYLGPNFTKAWSQLTGLLERRTGGDAAGSSGSHSLFAGSTIPAYEIAAALASPLLLAGLVGVAVLHAAAVRVRTGRWQDMTATWWRTPSASLLTALAAVYFATLPLLLTAAGNEVARRSWTYTWIGVAFVVGVLVDRLLQPCGARHARRFRLRLRPALLLAGLAVLAVGGVAAGQNDAYRFPGPFVQGSDTRGTDDELLALAGWMATSVPRDSWVSADRYTAALLTSYGRQRLVVPWQEVPLWGWVTGAESAGRVMRSVARTEVAYLVVDSRMATSQPASGFWYDKNEPGAVHATPVPAELLRRFDCLPSSEGVYASEHFTVYRVDVRRYREDADLQAQAALRLAAGPRAGAAADGSWERPSPSSLEVLTSRRCP